MATQPRPIRQEEEDPRATLDASEIPWKKERKGRVATAAELQGWFEELFQQAADAEKDAGVRAHRIGTAANKVYAHWGEAVAGAPSFKALLTQKLEFSDLAVSTVYQYMQFADVTTEEEAGQFGITKALLGLELLPFAQVETLAALKRVDLPIVDPRTKRPARFPATRKLLQRALLEYRLAALGGKAEPRAVQVELRRHVTAIDATLKKHPELAELRPTAFVFDGVVKLRVAAFTADHLEALASLTRRLRRSA